MKNLFKRAFKCKKSILNGRMGKGCNGWTVEYTDQQFVLVENANQLIDSIEHLRTELAQKNQIINELQQCIHQLTRSNSKFPLMCSSSAHHKVSDSPRQQRNGLVRSASIMSNYLRKGLCWLGGTTRQRTRHNSLDQTMSWGADSLRRIYEEGKSSMLNLPLCQSNDSIRDRFPRSRMHQSIEDKISPSVRNTLPSPPLSEPESPKKTIKKYPYALLLEGGIDEDELCVDHLEWHLNDDDLMEYMAICEDFLGALDEGQLYDRKYRASLTSEQYRCRRASVPKSTFAFIFASTSN